VASVVTGAEIHNAQRDPADKMDPLEVSLHPPSQAWEDEAILVERKVETSLVRTQSRVSSTLPWVSLEQLVMDMHLWF